MAAQAHTPTSVIRQKDQIVFRCDKGDYIGNTYSYCALEAGHTGEHATADGQTFTHSSDRPVREVAGTLTLDDRAELYRAEQTSNVDTIAEQALLGALLTDPAQLAAVTSIVTGADFYHVKHATIFNAIVEVAATGAPAEAPAVGILLGQRDELFRIGGLHYLHTCIQAAPVGNAAYYAETVAAQAHHRRQIEVSTRILDMARTGSSKWAAEVAAAQQLAAPAGTATGGLRSRLYTRSAARDIPKAAPLIEGILDQHTMALILGKFGSYKSFVSVAWACSIATGTAWEGHEVRSPGPVIYVAAEGASGLESRISAWEYGHQIRVPDDRLYILDGRAKLDDPAHMAELKSICQEIRPQLVVVDTLHQCAGGLDEKDNGDAGVALSALGDIRDLGVTILTNHHTGHGGQHGRGASAWEDDSDTVWMAQLDDAEDRSALVQRTLKHRKTKNGRLTDDIPIRLVEVPALADEWGVAPAYVVEGDVEATGKGKWLGQAEIVRRLDELGVPDKAGREKCVAALKAAGTSIGAGQVMREAVKERQSRVA